MAIRGDYSEKRDFIRMAVDCKVQFQIEGAGPVYEGVGKNLSATGVQFESPQDLEVGAKLDIKVLPKQALTPPLDAVAEVVRVDMLAPGKYVVGCKLLEVKN